MSELSFNFDLHFVDEAALDFVAAGLEALAANDPAKAKRHFESVDSDLGINAEHPTWGLEAFSRSGLKCSGSVVAHAHGDFAPAAFLKALAELGAPIVLGTVYDETNRRRRLAYENGKKVSATSLVDRLVVEDPDYALNRAVVSGKLKDAAAALERGANPDAVESTWPYIVLATYKSAGLVAALIDAGANVDAVNAKGDSALNEAISNENLAAVNKLVAAGADVNKANRHGWTPLHCATGLEGDVRARIIRLLVEAGARFDDGASTIMSPLLLAVYNSAREISGRRSEERDACVTAACESIDLLLSAGCSPHASFEGYGNLLATAKKVPEIVDKVRSLGVTDVIEPEWP